MKIPEINLNDIVWDSAMLYYGKFNLSDVDTLMTQLEGKELGLSDGGVKFTSTPDIRKIPIQGHLDRKLKGFERILKVDGKVEGEILVINKNTLQMSLYKKETITSSKYEKYVPHTGIIEDDMYGDLLVIGTTTGEVPVIAHIENTYNSELTLETADKEEGKIKINFESAYDPATNKVPISIYLPKEVSGIGE